MEMENKSDQHDEIHEISTKCDDLIYSVSFISPNYPSFFINIQKENIPEVILESKKEKNQAITSELLLNHKIKNIMNAKAINGELKYLVELSNGKISLISNSLADKFVPDNEMISFLLHKIKTNKNNSIPILSKNDISNNPHINFLQLPYSLSKLSYITTLNSFSHSNDLKPLTSKSDLITNQLDVNIESKAVLNLNSDECIAKANADEANQKKTKKTEKSTSRNSDNNGNQAAMITRSRESPKKTESNFQIKTNKREGRPKKSKKSK